LDKRIRRYPYGMVSQAHAISVDDTREGILAAALEAFTEKGFDGATARDIAARAGVNHGLIRYHFGNKQKLWQAAVDRAFEKLGEALEATGEPEEGDERERFRRLLRSYVHFVARNPEFVCLMNEEGKRRGPRMRWITDRHVKPLYLALGAMLDKAQAAGILPPELSPLHFHYALAGAVGLIFHQAEECRRLTGVDPFDDEVVERHADVIEQLFLGAAPPHEQETP
jgi:AcrR family transcriptional regulator